MIIDCSINRFKFSEREQALLHIDNMHEVIGKHKSLVIFDRGYPSGELFIELIGKQQKFLARLSSTTFKREQQQMRTEDCIVEIIFDSSRLRVHNGTNTKEILAQAGKISLRFIRVKLASGEYEYLATNISDQEFSTAEIFELYSMRWGIETTYDDLKNKLLIENFTGTKPILIEQDIYATIYLLNMSNDIMLEAQIELENANSKPHKHQMAINKNIAFGIMKEELVLFMLEKNTNKRKLLMNSIVDEIKKNLLPVRKGRHYTRNGRGRLASKYPNTKKKSF